ncbi:MAG: hypothetical protein EOP50_22350, partial [Sphingobacteriales bacterium]
MLNGVNRFVGMAGRVRIGTARLLSAILAVLALSAIMPQTAQAQTACTRNYNVTQGGGRQLIFAGPTINTGNTCAFPLGAGHGGSSLRKNGTSPAVGAIVITYPDGSIAERDASNNYYFTPSPTYAPTKVIFGDVAGGANPVTGTDNVTGTSGVFTLLT